MSEVREGFVLVDAKELKRLQEVDEWMDYLDAAGIDNTTAYEEAQQLRREARAEQDCE